MKKMVLVLMVMLMMAAVCCAEETNVFVSISNGAGELVMAYEEIVVTDADQDGALTIQDALYCVHAAKYEGGAEGYLAENTEYGLSLVRLWGEENGGSFGYYLNDSSAWSLLDAVKEGDHVKAYAFADLDAWSDTYSFFDANVITAAAKQEVALTLSAAGFDASWNPVTLPVAGAALTVNGEKTEAVTDENGKAVVVLPEAGMYVISAVSESQVLVPPVCIVTVEK